MALKLPYRMMGAKKGAPYLVTLAGFPDDEMSGFKNILVEFSSTHRIIAMCFPGFQKDGASNLPKWGYDLEYLRDAMHETLASIAEDEGQFEFTFVIHDWGAFLGLMYSNKYPERIKEIICFDVGIVRKPPIKSVIIILFYQMWFCASYAIATLISRWLGQFLLMFFFIFLSRFIGPAPYDTLHRPVQEVDVRMCYPYIQFYFGERGYFRAGPKKMARPRFPSGIPFFFMFGRKKNTMFHTDDFLDQLDEAPGCRWKAYEAGHWLHEHEDHKDDIVSEMKSFMKLS